MAVARFLQLSDLHLGRPFAWLPREKRNERRKDQREALEAAVAQAIERGVHAILIPGDFFDGESVDAESMGFAISAFSVTGCPPVMIAPGNHDPYFEASAYWGARLLKARGLEWPAHVHVFDTPAWTHKTLPNLEGVRIWGRCFTPNVISAERPLVPTAVEVVESAGEDAIDVALFHGSREGKCPPGQKVTGPFSDEEVQHAPFAYMAAGHYHAASRIDADGERHGGVRLAYAGSAVAIDLSETGRHGALDVTIEFGSGKTFTETELVQLDRRLVHDVQVDVGAAPSAEEVDRRIVAALDQVRAGDKDLVTIRLLGRMAPGVRYAGPGAEIAGRVFHLRTDLRAIRPDYDLDAYRSGNGSTTEERFAQALLERLDGVEDPEERTMLESALYYGLDAFRLQEVVPAYEDIGE